MPWILCCTIPFYNIKTSAKLSKRKWLEIKGESLLIKSLNRRSLLPCCLVTMNYCQGIVEEVSEKEQFDKIIRKKSSTVIV